MEIRGLLLKHVSFEHRPKEGRDLGGEWGT